MSKAVLVDIPKCVGCGSCTVACKLWNNREFDEKEPAFGEKPKMTDNNWTTVKINKVKKDGEEVLRFTKVQCMHCQKPACQVACFSNSFQVTDEGAVVYTPRLCVGCRYCMLACPFDIPRYEWDKILPSVTKCQMCYSRIEKGDKPACVDVCPTQALTFGDRDELLQLASKTIKENNYVNHIFGEKEAGGTNWLYISDVPFQELGFPTHVTTTALPDYLHDFHEWLPRVFIGGGAILAGLSVYTKRRNQISAMNEENDANTK